MQLLVSGEHPAGEVERQVSEGKNKATKTVARISDFNAGLALNTTIQSTRDQMMQKRQAATAMAASVTASALLNARVASGRSCRA